MKLYKIYKSKDNITVKFRFLIDKKYLIEFVLVERKEKNIICFPSQIGCILSCIFCKSGNYTRDLTPEEVYFCISEIKDYIKDNRKPLLLSCMGEGEPSLNNNIKEIIYSIYNLGDKLALATTGINTSIFKNLNEYSKKLKIMLSLHAVTTNKRNYLLKNSMNIEYLINEFRKYNGSKEVNYVLLDKYNDSYKDCIVLRKLCGDIPIKLNKYNNTIPTLKASRKVKMFMFLYKMLYGKIEYYETDGVDIQAACGMMNYQIK